MNRIPIPPGMTLSATICIERVTYIELEDVTEFHVEGFTRDLCGELKVVVFVLGTYSAMKVQELSEVLKSGAIFSIDDEPFSFEGDVIHLYSPDLSPWRGENVEDLGADGVMEETELKKEIKDIELVARKIANRSKRQRHYFDDEDDVSPSRTVKGLWTYGRETYGLQKAYIYVPAQSRISLDELADLLARIDRKLERAGRFKRILCPYGGAGDDMQVGQGAILSQHYAIEKDHWYAALKLLTESGDAPIPILFKTFRVAYRHAFGSTAFTRPGSDDPVIVVAPHRHVTVPEKMARAVRGARRRLSWVFYDPEQGWSMETKTFRPEVSGAEWQPPESLVHSVRQRILDERRVCEAVTTDHKEFPSAFLNEVERKQVPDSPTAKECFNLVKKCLHEPVSEFFTQGHWVLRFDDVGARMVNELADNQLISLVNSEGKSFLVEVRQDCLYLENGVSLLEKSYDGQPLKIVVSGDLCITIAES